MQEYGIQETARTTEAAAPSKSGIWSGQTLLNLYGAPISRFKTDLPAEKKPPGGALCSANRNFFLYFFLHFCLRLLPSMARRLLIAVSFMRKKKYLDLFDF